MSIESTSCPSKLFIVIVEKLAQLHHTLLHLFNVQVQDLSIPSPHCSCEYALSILCVTSRICLTSDKLNNVQRVKACGHISLTPTLASIPIESMRYFRAIYYTNNDNNNNPTAVCVWNV